MGECVLTSRHGEIPTEIVRIASDFEIGETITIKVNDIPTEFIVVHQGLPSTGYDESCNGTWFLMKDIYSTYSFCSQVYNEEYDWYEADEWCYTTYCNIVNHLSSILDLFDADIVSKMKEAKIPNPGYFFYISTSSDASTAVDRYTTTGGAHKLFLLSATELGFPDITGTKYPDYYALGDKLAYFSSGTTDEANSLRIAFKDNVTTRWWTRTPTCREVDASFVTTTGTCSRTDGDYVYGVRPAFILPSDTLLTISLEN